MKIIHHLELGLLMFCFLGWIWIDFSPGYIGGGILGLLYLCALALITFYLFLGIRRKRKDLLVRTSIYFFALVLCTVAAAYRDADINNRSQKTAELIANKIEQYRQEQGDFPAALENLVPQYLVEIPWSSRGFLIHYPFWYNPYIDRDGFYLSFPSSFFKLYTYDSVTKEWSVDD